MRRMSAKLLSRRHSELNYGYNAVDQNSILLYTKLRLNYENTNSVKCKQLVIKQLKIYNIGYILAE